jgi:hypothetical protein
VIVCAGGRANSPKRSPKASQSVSPKPKDKTKKKDEEKKSVLGPHISASIKVEHKEEPKKAETPKEVKKAADLDFEDDIDALVAEADELLNMGTKTKTEKSKKGASESS